MCAKFDTDDGSHVMYRAMRLTVVIVGLFLTFNGHIYSSQGIVGSRPYCSKKKEFCLGKYFVKSHIWSFRGCMGAKFRDDGSHVTYIAMRLKVVIVGLFWKFNGYFSSWWVLVWSQILQGCREWSIISACFGCREWHYFRLFLLF